MASADLEVTETGSGDDLVVFVHGALGSGRSFDRVAENLDAEFRMVWFDRRGYGTNADADGAPAGVDRHIADVVDVIDGRTAIVVGHSFGGVTAIGAAVRAPEGVDAVVAYETSMAWVPGWDDTVMQGIFAHDDPVDAGLRMMLGDRYDTLAGDDRARRVRDGRAFIAEERSVRTGFAPYDVRELRVPLVYGRSDERVMPVVLDHLRRTVPQLDVVTIPGAGHHAHRTDPADFAALVRRARPRRHTELISVTIPAATTPGVVLGERLGPFAGVLDADLVRRYAAATTDPNTGPNDGTAVPPVAVVTQIWDAQQAAFGALVPQEVRASMTGGVHGEHDVVLHRPIVPGETLQTWVEGQGSRRGGTHNLVTMRYSTYDDHDALVAEQWWTTVLLNAAGEPVGDAAPDHTLPEAARAHHVGDYRINADDEMPRRYAEVSRDWSGHHFTVEAARGSGSERPFLHGLCTMALCAQGVVALVADGDPDRVSRVAVRFASPSFVGEDVEVHLFQVDDHTYAFEAESLGAPVIRNGIAELRS